MKPLEKTAWILVGFWVLMSMLDAFAAVIGYPVQTVSLYFHLGLIQFFLGVALIIGAME